MKKQSKWIKTAVIGLMLLFSAVAPVFAAEEGIEPKETGSITIQLEDGEADTSKEGVVFAYEKVAEIVNGEYELTETFRESKVNLNELEHAEDFNQAVKTLIAYASASKKQVITDSTGVVTIDDLETGAYLLWVTNQNQYEVTAPALVSVPMWDEEETQMQYDVTVIPKHSTNPKEAPQTGDDSKIWLYGTALVIVGFAVILMLRRKRR